MVTRKEADAMATGVFIFAHSIEKMINIIEQYHEEQFKLTKEYKDLVNQCYSKHIMNGVPATRALKFAEADVNAELKRQNHEVLMTKSPINYQHYINLLHELKDMTDEFTEQGMKENTLEGEDSGARAYDATMKDADRMCRIWCNMYNADGREQDAEDATMRYDTTGILTEDFKSRYFQTKL